jgi:hypothetical protein
MMRLKRVRRLQDHVQWMSVAVILGALLFACPEFASSQETYCPKSISVVQTSENVPQGWTARLDDSPSTLAGITFYSGPPEEEASLAYDQWTKRNGLAYGVWRFPKSSHRIWLSCHYSFTRIVLGKQLPVETSECTVIYDPKVSVSGLPEIQKITCH